MMQLLPIVGLLVLIALVYRRLPKIDLGYSPEYLRRRLINWLPLGLTYSFLYMGRYNLTVSKNALGDLMSKEDFGTIFFWGTLVYGCAFVINGPLTDRLGGRRTILISAAGSAVMNILMGATVYNVLQSGTAVQGSLTTVFSFLYAVNMYFQSFGAVAVVKVNAPWFHIRERGSFGGVFGILIALGIYFAYDGGRLIVESLPVWWVFYIPAIILALFWIIDYFYVFDSPQHTGFANFDTGDASSGTEGESLPVLQVAGRMLSNPIIVVIALIEFCSGFLRNAIMQWYVIFAHQTGIQDSFVPKNWGMLLCAAGILGGVLAGIVSDRIFDSRRGPVAAILYAGILVGGVAACLFLDSAALGYTTIFMSLCVIGVHGMLSGTASMDFGGHKNAGVAVGIIDGFVYLGTAAQAMILGKILPTGAAQSDPNNWHAWPLAMLPAALVGLLLATRVWQAKPATRPLRAN